MTINFPTLKSWQLDVYNAMENSRNSGKVFVVKAKRQVGKSIIAAIETIKFALEKPCVSIIIEPTLVQCRRVFKDITKWLENSNLLKNVNNGLLEIQFNNGSEIIFKSAEQRDRLRGYTVSGLLVVDEAAFIPDDIIEIILPFTDAHKAPCLFISTPLFCDGAFYKLFNSADNKTSFSFDWATYDTSEFLSEDKLNYYRQNLSEQKFKSEYLGQFITDGSFVFSNISSIYNTDEKFDNNNSEKFLGIDWGTGQNQDYTAITTFVKNNSKYIITDLKCFNDVKPLDQIELIANYISNTNNVNVICVEKNSIGNIYIDALRKKLKRPNLIKPFITTNESKRNIIENMVKVISNSNLVLLNNLDENAKNEFIKELQHYTIQKTPNGGLTYNAMQGFHDDLIMATAIGLNAITANKKYNIKIK